MPKQRSKKRGIIVVLLAVLVSCLALVNVVVRSVQATDLSWMAVDFDQLVDKSDQYLSLSEVDPLRAQVGYGQFLKDKVGDGSKIALKYEGAWVIFERGLWAHASSNLYYDLGALRAGERDLDYFTAYIGLNRTSSSGNGVKYAVYGSNDPAILQGQHLAGSDYWDTLYNAEGKVTLPGQEAEFLRIKVSEYRFLRLQIDANGSNGVDHSVWADAKLAREDYEPYLVPAVAEIDAELSGLGGAVGSDS